MSFWYLRPTTAAKWANVIRTNKAWRKAVIKKSLKIFLKLKKLTHIQKQQRISRVKRKDLHHFLPQKIIIVKRSFVFFLKEGWFNYWTSYFLMIAFLFLKKTRGLKTRDSTSENLISLFYTEQGLQRGGNSTAFTKLSWERTAPSRGCLLEDTSNNNYKINSIHFVDLYNS